MTDRVVTVDDTFKLPPDVLTPLDARYPAAAGSGSTVVTVGKSAKFNYNTASYASDDLAVQAAVDAIPAGYNGGTEIRIGPGIFNFVGGVNTTAKHNVTISGSLATIIQWKNGNTFAAATAATNWLFKLGDYAVLRDLQLRGCSTFTCPINGVNTQPAGGTNTLGGGVWWNGGRVWLDRLYVTNMAEDGLTNSGGIGTKYTDIGIIACGGWGLNMTANLGNNGVNYATDGDLSSVWVGACGQGLIVNTGGIWISGAHVWGCQGDGIYLNGDAVRVIGCYPENNAGWGININSRSRCIIQGNDVWANGLGSVQKGGIQTLGSANSNVITSNLLRDNRYHAVLLAGSSSRNTVALNTVCDSYYRQASSPATLITYTASATLAAGTSTFTDANAPAWMTSFSAVGLTIVIQGAGHRLGEPVGRGLQPDAVDPHGHRGDQPGLRRRIGWFRCPGVRHRFEQHDREQRHRQERCAAGSGGHRRGGDRAAVLLAWQLRVDGGELVRGGDHPRRCTGRGPPHR